MYSNRIWSDIRNLLVSPRINNHTVENLSKLDKKSIIKATGFSRNKKREIELVALENHPLREKIVLNCSGINT